MITANTLAMLLPSFLALDELELIREGLDILPSTSGEIIDHPDPLALSN
jgi:hypothetical protein